MRAAAVALLCVATLTAQPPNPNARANFVKYDAPIIVLGHVRVVDGTGAPGRENQTVVIRNGNISAVGDAAAITVPAGATTIDLTGRTVIPGLVMMHEHLYYTTGPGVYGQLGLSFSRLYLAGGVTTMRTAGNTNGIMDINLARRIADGELAGPAIDATMPYLNGPNTFLQMDAVTTPEAARRHVAYWAEEGATSVKAYMQISRAALKAGIDEAHRRSLKVTGHLCSVTYGEAADLGIDNLEHGFFAATDFVSNKQPDTCPGQAQGQQALAAIDENSAPFRALVEKLVSKHVALTSTLTVFETLTPGRPTPPGLDVLTPQLRDAYMRAYDRAQQNSQSVMRTLFHKDMALERAFVKAGGVLMAGTDPTAAGGVIPGYADQRQLELLVEAGFTPAEAISIGTLNAAKYLGRDSRIGSIANGKQADLVVVLGDPSKTIGDVRRVEAVFKAGVGYDPQKLVDSVKGSVGIW
ncbi:MAG TPA: amidohydrolase family protein [Vicinamibacterales bacterium]|jgi:enamidase